MEKDVGYHFPRTIVEKPWGNEQPNRPFVRPKPEEKPIEKEPPKPIKKGGK